MDYVIYKTATGQVTSFGSVPDMTHYDLITPAVGEAKILESIDSDNNWYFPAGVKTARPPFPYVANYDTVINRDNIFFPALDGAGNWPDTLPVGTVTTTTMTASPDTDAAFLIQSITNTTTISASLRIEINAPVISSLRIRAVLFPYRDYDTIFDVLTPSTTHYFSGTPSTFHYHYVNSVFFTAPPPFVVNVAVNQLTVSVPTSAYITNLQVWDAASGGTLLDPVGNPAVGDYTWQLPQSVTQLIAETLPTGNYWLSGFFELGVQQGSLNSRVPFTIQTGTFVGSPLTTKGDIWTHTTVDDRLPVGINNEYLVADSTTASGLDWKPLISIGGIRNIRVQAISLNNQPLTGLGASYSMDGNVLSNGMLVCLGNQSTFFENGIYQYSAVSPGTFIRQTTYDTPTDFRHVYADSYRGFSGPARATFEDSWLYVGSDDISNLRTSGTGFDGIDPKVDSGFNSLAFGSNSFANNEGAIALGRNTVAQHVDATVLNGGKSNVDNSLVLHAANNLNIPGQQIWTVNTTTTTNALSVWVFPLVNSTATLLKAYVTAYEQNGNKYSSWELLNTFRKDGAGNVGGVTHTGSGRLSGSTPSTNSWACQWNTSGLVPNQNIRLEFEGDAATTVQWAAMIIANTAAHV